MKNTPPPRGLRGQGYTGAAPPTAHNHFMFRSMWSRGKFQIVTGLPCKPRQFERPPTTLSEPCASLGAKRRLRATEGSTQRTRGVAVERRECVARQKEGDTRPERRPTPERTWEEERRPSRRESPKAPADKKAWGFIPQTPISLAPGHRGGGPTVGRGVEEEGRGPPDDGAKGRGPRSDGPHWATARSDEPSRLQSNKADGSPRQTKTPWRIDVVATTSNPTEQQIGVGKMCFPTTVR